MKKKVLNKETLNKDAIEKELLKRDFFGNVSVRRKFALSNGVLLFLAIFIATLGLIGIKATDYIENTDIICLVIIILVVGAITFCIQLTLVVGNSILNPLKYLLSFSEHIKSGNFSIIDCDDILLARKDEFGVLAKSMQETKQSLHTCVSETDKVLHSIAKGNLDISAKDIPDFQGDFAAFKESLVYILNNLNSTLSDIHQVAEQVNSGSDQVAAGSQALSQGATEQASAVQQLAATVNDINTHVQRTGIEANAASEKTTQAGQMMVSCDNQMKSMVAAMDEISHTSEEIGKIIKAIEDIAFQTNILALNAAVEAARAGNAGKGFAVVADEVRNLAAKSAEASQNTASLIEASMSAVANGVKIANSTADQLRQAASSAQEVSDKVAAIAAAAQEQAASIEQVSAGIDQISNVVQTNSATAEESAAASEELSGQASALKSSLNQFRLRGM